MSDLLPTQDVDEAHQTINEDVDQIHTWGRLLPLKKNLPAIELILDSYTVGRAEECDVTLVPEMFDDPACLSTFSKKHFRIFWVGIAHCKLLLQKFENHGKIVFIQDFSRNGTLVNGTKIGCGKIQPLNNNDEISLCMSHLKYFIFSDSSCMEDAYPIAVTSRFTVSKLLGRGTYGEVRLVFDKDCCTKRAMKIVQKSLPCVKIGDACVCRIQSEADILMKMKHPCIIGIYDVIDTIDSIYMILELVEGGELFDRIIALGQIPEQEAKFLFLQVIFAVEYLHERGITHRDLKPENILLTSSDNQCLIKVTDFGLSKFVHENTLLRTFCGTPTYLAPEILLTAGSGTYTSSVDVWSLGVILYVCLVGYPPFTDERDDFDLQTQITRGIYYFPETYWKDISNDAKNLVRRMLTVEPSERITIQAVLEDPWLNDTKIKQDVCNLIAQSAPIESTIDSDGSEIPTKKRDIASAMDIENKVDIPVQTTLFSTTVDDDSELSHKFLHSRAQPPTSKRPSNLEHSPPRKQCIWRIPVPSHHCY